MDSRSCAGLPFRIVPLGCLLAAGLLSLRFGPAWSMRAAAVPWLIALVVVGLPHGAADLAVSRRLCGAPATIRLFAIYTGIMAVVMLVFLSAPRTSVALFGALSIWHFGLSHADGQAPPPLAAWQGLAVAAVARGASVLGVPLAAWPDATAAVVADLIGLVGRVGQASPDVFSPATLRATGICLTAAAMVALALEAVASRGVAGARRRSADTLVDLLVIGFLGGTTDPLFSIGLYFLCWHAWREMRPLMAIIAKPAVVCITSGEETENLSPPPGPAAFIRDLAAVHVAALPLLIPTWIALWACWWLLSPSHSARDLAVLSVVVYLVVTPSHEALLDFLRSNGSPRSDFPPMDAGRHPGRLRNRLPTTSCAARSASS